MTAAAQAPVQTRSAFVVVMILTLLTLGSAVGLAGVHNRIEAARLADQKGWL